MRPPRDRRRPCCCCAFSAAVSPCVPPRRRARRAGAPCQADVRVEGRRSGRGRRRREGDDEVAREFGAERRRERDARRRACEGRAGAGVGRSTAKNCAQNCVEFAPARTRLEAHAELVLLARAEPAAERRADEHRLDAPRQPVLEDDLQAERRRPQSELGDVVGAGEARADGEERRDQRGGGAWERRIASPDALSRFCSTSTARSVASQRPKPSGVRARSAKSRARPAVTIVSFSDAPVGSWSPSTVIRSHVEIATEPSCLPKRSPEFFDGE